MIPARLKRARVLALRASVAAGATPHLWQLEKAGLVVRGSSIATAARPPAEPAADDGTLLAAYCRRLGRSVPFRFRSAAHEAQVSERVSHGRRS